MTHDHPVDDSDLSPDIHPDRLLYLVTNIARSFLFFTTNFCWIEAKAMTGERIGETRFALWPAQRPICSLFVTKRLLSILKARQLGLTWLTAAYCLWSAITRRGILAVVISAKEDWAVELLDRVRFMYNRLPVWLQPELAKDGSQHMRFVFEWDKDGKKPLVYSDIKSLTTTQEGAQSKTPDILVMDETARNRYAKEIFGASKPGIDKAGGQIIVISNAHKRGPGWSWTRDICSGAMRGENTFHFIFMPWWDCPERLTDDEKAILETDPDFTPSTFKNMQLADGVDPLDVSENYPDTPEEALATIHGSYFGDTLSRHTRYAVKGVIGTLYRDRDSGGELYFDPKRVGYKQTGPYIIELWRYPYFLLDNWDGQYWADRYVMGSDVSEGQGRSYSVAYVMDRQLDELVCRIRSNRIDAVDWSDYLNLLSLYYVNFYPASSGNIGRIPAMICVERTGAGITTVKELEKKGANQFIRQLFAKRGEATQTNDIGWHEDRQSKHVLCGDLKQWFRTMRGHIYDQVLIDETSTTIEHDSGAIGPEKGKEWDTVVAAGCTLQSSLQIGGPPTIVQPVRTEQTHSAASNWGR